MGRERRGGGGGGMIEMREKGGEGTRRVGWMGG